MATKHLKGITAASLAAGLLAAPLANAAPDSLLPPDLHHFDPGLGVLPNGTDVTGGVDVLEYFFTATNTMMPFFAPWTVTFTDDDASGTLSAGDTGTERFNWILLLTDSDGAGGAVPTVWSTTPTDTDFDANIDPGSVDSPIFVNFDLTVVAKTPTAPNTIEWDYTGLTFTVWRDDTALGVGDGYDMSTKLAEFSVTGVDGVVGTGNTVNLNIFGDKTFMAPGVFTIGATDLSLVDFVFGFTRHNAFLVDSVTMPNGSELTGITAFGDPCVGSCDVILRTNTQGQINQNQIGHITVPEPATLGLLGLGFMGLGAASRRRRRQA